MAVEPELQEKLQVDIQPTTSTALKQEHTKPIQTEQQPSMINMVVKLVLLKQTQVAELFSTISMAEKLEHTNNL